MKSVSPPIPWRRYSGSSPRAILPWIALLLVWALGLDLTSMAATPSAYWVVPTVAELVASDPGYFTDLHPDSPWIPLAVVTTTGDSVSATGVRNWVWNATATGATNTASAGGPLAWPFGASAGRWVQTPTSSLAVPGYRLMVIPPLYPDPTETTTNPDNPTSHFQKYIDAASYAYSATLGRVRLDFPSGHYTCDELVWKGKVIYNSDYEWHCKKRSHASGTANRSIMRTQRVTGMNVDPVDGAFLSWVTSPVDYSNPDNWYGLTDDVWITGKGRFIFDQNGKDCSLPLCRLLEVRRWVVDKGCFEVYHNSAATNLNSWAISLTGRDVTWYAPTVRGGQFIVQDGLHICAGKNITVIGGYFESGDDAVAVECEAAGGSTASADEAAENINISGFTVKSNRARAVAVCGGVNQINVPYVNGLRVRDVTITNFSGTCSEFRQSALYVGSYQAPDGIWEYVITNPGSGYTDGYYVLDVTATGGGTGAKCHLKVSGGKIVRAVLAKVSGSFKFGSGYFQNQSVILTGLGSGTGGAVTGKVFGLPNDRVQRVLLDKFTLASGGVTHDGVEPFGLNLRGASDVTLRGAIAITQNSTNPVHRPFSILACSNVVLTLALSETQRGGSINTKSYPGSSVDELYFRGCSFGAMRTSGNGVIKFNGTGARRVYVQNSVFTAIPNGLTAIYLPDFESNSRDATEYLEVSNCRFVAESASPSNVRAMDFVPVTGGSGNQLGFLRFINNEIAGATLMDTAASVQASCQAYEIYGNFGAYTTTGTRWVNLPAGARTVPVTVDTYTGLPDATDASLAGMRVTPLGNPGFAYWVTPNTTGSFNIQTSASVDSDVQFQVELDTTQKPVRALREYWSFNRPQILTEAQRTVGTTLLTLLTGSSTVLSAGSDSSFTGQNSDDGEGTGTYLKVANPAGAAVVAQMPTTGVNDVLVRYETRALSGGTSVQRVSYTTDGSSYQTFRTVAPEAASPTLVDLDFSTVSGASNNPKFGIRIDFDTSTATQGIDDLSLTGAPLPGFLAAACPKLSAFPVQQAWDGDAFSLRLAGVAAVPDAHTFSLVTGPPGLTVDSSGLVSWVPPSSLVGTVQTAVVRVQDDSSPTLTTLGSVDIRVDSNVPPVLAQPSDTAVQEKFPLSVVLSATDSDGLATDLAYSLVSGPAGMVVSRLGTVSWTPSESQGPGVHVVTVKVTDGGSPPRSDEKSFSITVSEVNDVPTLTRPSDLTVDELSPISMNLSASDPDLPAQTLTFSLLGGPAGLQLGADGHLTWTPTEAQGPGVFSVGIQVSDGGSPPLTDVAIFTITVRETNAAPVLVPPEGLVVRELVPVSLRLTAVDTDLPAQPLTFSLVNGPPGLAVSASGVLTWTPTELQGPAAYPVTVTVADNGSPSRTDSRTFTITVDEANTPPVLTKPSDLTVDESSPVSVSLVASDADLPAQSLTYSVVEGPAGMTVNASGVLSWTPTEAQGPGKFQITVLVTDNALPPESDSKSFFITVREVNSSPALTVPQGLVVDETKSLILPLQATDADLPAQKLTFALVDGPSGLAVSSTGVLTWTPSPTQGPGAYPVTVRVTDAATPPASDTQTFSITVQELNHPPVLTAPADALVVYPATFSLNLTASDPDVPAQALSYSLVSGPAGMSVDPAGGILWTPEVSQVPGSYPVEVRVTDDGTPPLSDVRAFYVTVSGGEIPEVSAPAGLVIAEQVPLSFRLVTAGLVPPQQEGVYSLVEGPEGLAVASDGLVTWTPTEAQGPGVYALSVSVADPGTAEVIRTDNVTLTVTEFNGPPVLTNPGNVNVSESQPWTIQLSATDPDLPAQSLTYSLLDGPEGLTVQPDGAVLWTPNELQGSGVYQVHVRVTDDGVPARSADAQFQITVLDGNQAPQWVVPVVEPLDELSDWRLLLHAADPDVPAQGLTYSLVSGPPGLTVAPDGMASWSPGEDAGPGQYTVTVLATDTGVPPASTPQSFTLVVQELNTAPVLSIPADRSVAEGVALSLNLSATDADLPVQQLTFSLVSGPTGLTVSPAGLVQWTPSEDQGPGVFPVVVQVRDDGTPPLADLVQFNVTVGAVNLVPELVSPGNLTINELVPLSLQLVASDPNLPGQNLTFQLVSGPAGMALNAAGVLTWTPTEAQGPGTNSVTVRFSDDGSPALSDTHTFSVTVLEVNAAPILAKPADGTVVRGGTFSRTLSATDSDLPAQALTYSLVSGPTGMTVSASGALVWTPSASQSAGDYLVNVRVTDTGTAALSDLESFTVTLKESNLAPVLQRPADRTIKELALMSFSLSATDADVPAQTLTYSLVTGPAGLTVSTAGVVSWTPTETQGPGVYTATVKVTDNGSPVLTDVRSFSLTVEEANLPPVLSTPTNRSVTELTTLSFNLSATDADLPAQSLSYGLFSGPTGMSVSPTGVVTWTPTEVQGPGTYSITVQVTDGGTPQYTDSKTFQVTVLEANTAPVLVRPADTTVVELRPFMTPLVATDTDLPTQLLFYSLVSGPAGLTVTTSGAVNWTPTEAQGPGVYPVTVRVSDNATSPLTATQTFTLTVIDVNSLPVLTDIADQTVNELSTLALTLTAVDSDTPAQVLTYSLASGPPGMTVSTNGALSWTPTESQGPGTYVVTVSVTDDPSPPLTESLSFTVTVNEVNLAPSLAKPSDRTLNESTPLSFSLSATDADLPAQTLTYGLVDGPAGMTVGTSGTVSWTPSEAQGPGTYLILVKVTDGGVPALSATNSFSVTVNEVNLAPVLPKPADQTVSELALFSFNLSATDSDLPAQTLSFGLVSGPAGLTVNAAGAVNWTPTESQGPGTYTVTVKVSDTGSPALSATNSFSVTVNDVNTPPSLSQPPDQTVNELATLTFNLSGSDGDLPVQALTFALVSGPAGMGVTGPGGVSWTPTEAQGPGIYPVLVKVSDNGIPSLSATNSFSVTVNEVNSVPSLPKPTDQNVNELALVSFSVSATDSDLPAQTLTYALVSGPAGLTVSGAGVVEWTPTELQGPGSYPVTLKVTDGGTPALSATNSFSVTVNEVNSVPLLAKPADQSIGATGSVTLQLSATDADLPAQTLTYGLVSGPTGMTVSGTGAVSWTPSQGQTSTNYQVLVRVTDSGTPPLSATNSFSVVVTGPLNSPPVLTQPLDQTLDELKDLSFDLTATDADVPAQTLTFALVSGPAGLGVSGAGAVTWTPTEAQGPGTYVVQVKVTDNGSPTMSATNSFSVTVNEVNVAPVLAPPLDQDVNELATLSFTLLATDADLPAQTLTYGLVSGPAGLGVNGAGLVTWTPSEVQGPGTYPVFVQVTDSGTPALSVTNSFSVTVHDVNSAPFLAKPSDQTIQELATMSFNLSATDGDVPVQTLIFGLVSGPAGLTVSEAGAVEWTPTESQGPGTHPVLVKVTDSGVPPISVTNSFSVTVSEVNTAPDLTKPADRAVDEFTTLSFSLGATDPDLPAQTLTYSLVSGPSGLTVSTVGAVSWTPGETMGGTVSTVTVKVTDSGTPPLSATNSFDVTVNEANTVPELIKPSDRTLNELTALSFNLSASDPDVPAQTLTYSLVSGPTGLTVSPTGTVSWTPAEDQGPGSYAVTVKATDSGTPPLSDSHTFTVTVTEVNTAPQMLQPENQTVKETTLLSFSLGATDSDLPAQTLTYSLVSGPSGLSVSSDGLVTWTPSRRQGPNVYTVTVKVTDNGSPALSDSHSFKITVNEVNSAPMMTPPGDQTVDELAAWSFALSATDTDVPVQTLTFSLVSGPSGLTVSPTGTISWTPTETQGPGVYAVSVRVTDSASIPLSDTHSFNVTVLEANTAPGLVGPGDKTVDELSLLSFTLTATDTDLPAQTLTYSVVTGPAGLTVSPAGAVSWTPTEAQGAGIYPVSVRVTDSGSPALSDTHSFNVTVREVNTAPGLVGPGDKTVDELSLLSFTLTATDTDLPAQTLTYSLVSGPAGLTVSGAGALAWTPTEAQGPGTYSVSVAVTDSGTPAQSATNTFTVTVNEVNGTPNLAKPADRTADELALLSFTLTATDADLPAQTLTYALVTGPAGLTVSGAGAVAWTPTEAQGPGTYPVSVSVTDSGTPPLSATNTFSVTVQDVNSAPDLAKPADRTVDELTLLAFTLTSTDPDLPAQTLTYALVSGPTGLTVSGAGAVAWTPTEAQGPGTYPVSVSVTDSGTPALSVTNTFTVTVTEVNTVPDLAKPADRTVDELSLLTFNLTATDGDLPAQTLTYALVGGPAGLTVSGAGAVAWTPTEAQGPGTYPVSVSVTDSGTPPLSATNTFTVTVQDVNSAPNLAKPADRTVDELTLLTFNLSATDTDLPAQTLTYALVSGPTGLTVSGAGAVAWTPTEAQGPGTYPVSVSVTDSGTPALSATNTFTVTVTEVNGVPDLPKPADRTVDELTLLTFNLTATDADLPAQTLTYALVSGPTGLTVSGTGAVAWTPTEAQGPGTYPVSVAVTDSGTPALSATNTFSVTVNEVNGAPALAKPADRTVDELASMSFTLSATDTDLPAQTLTYALVSGPTGLTVSGAGAVAWTPTEAQGPGTYPVSVAVTDSGTPAMSATNTFSVTVNEVNGAPALTKPADRTVDELALMSFTLSATDTDLPAQTLTYTLVSGPAGLTVSGVGAVAWTPTEAQGPGTYPVSVAVTDSGTPGLSATNTFTVTVNEVNGVPNLATPTDRTVDELTLLTFNLSATDTDLPAQTLTYALVSGPTGLTVSGAGAVAWTPTEAQGPGTYPVSVSVTDSGTPALSATNTFTVTVRDVNSAPNLAKPADRTVDELTLLTFNLSATDTDLPAQTLTYTLVSGPAGLTVSGAGAVAWTPTEAQGPGTYPVSVAVTDSGTPALSATNTFTVTVNEANLAPDLVKPTDRTVDELTLLTFNLAATDADLPVQTLTYALVSGPTGLTVSGSGAVAWTPTEAQGAGTYPVSVSVTDSGTPALSVTNAFTVTVNEVNLAPVLAKPADRTVDELTLLTFNLSATDADLPAQTLTYALVSGPAGLTVSGAGAVAWTPTEAQGPGTYPVSVSVTDSGTPALSATNAFTVTVNDVNGAPILTKPADRTVDELAVMSFNLSATDADLPAQTLTYALVSGPTGLTVSGAGAVAWTPTEAQGPGVYSVSVKVTDNGVPALSGTNAFTVTVNEVPDGLYRTVWQIGVDDNPAVSPYNPSGEFSPENRVNDVRPGKVTRLPGDPIYDANPGANPTADDDFYFYGTYPVGFNGLTALLTVPNDEPAVAWERAHTQKDMTNRVHFVLAPAQVATGAAFRLSMEFSSGGVSLLGTNLSGFGTNDMVIRFRNGSGVATNLYSQRILARTNLVLDFTAAAVGASAGANTIEIVRTGPAVVNYSYWIQYDYLRLEATAIGNLVPDLAKPADRSVDELATLAFNLAATDADLPAQTLTYSLVTGPSGLTVSGTGAVNWTPTEAQGPGSYPVTVRVTDSGVPAQIDTESFTVTVNEVNATPDLAKPSDFSLGELSLLSFNLSATDADLPAQTLSYVLVDGPPGLRVDGAGLLTWTPSELQGPGVYPVTVRVTDNGVPPLSDTEVFSVTVTEVNLAPDLAKPADRTVDEQAALSFSLVAVDADLPPQGLVFSLVDGPAGLTLSPLGAVAWTPTEAQGPGTYTVTARVTDTGTPPLSDTETFTVTVNEANAVPDLAKPADQTVDELTLLSFNLTATDPDLPAQTLTYALVSGPTGLTVTGAGAVAWTPTEAQGPGTYPVSVAVTDSGTPALSATNTFTVTVNEVNVAPDLPKPADRTVDEVTLLTFNLTATDSDLPAQTLTYALVSGPTGLTVSGAGAVAWTPTEAQGPGTYPVSVSVTDSGTPALSATNTFTVTVQDVNSAPNLAKPADRTVDELTLLTFNLSATDTDLPAQTLTYALVSGPTGLTVSGAGAVAWTPTEAQGPGIYPVSVSVTDSGTPPLSVTNTFTVTVTEVNTVPDLAKPADRTVDELTLLTFNLTATDADLPAQTLTYALVSGPAGLTVSGVGAVAWTPTEAQGPGTYPVSVSVTDSGTPPLSATNTFTVTVQDVNSAPNLAKPADRTVDELASMSFTLSATDTDLPAQTLTYTLVSGPAGLTVSGVGAVAWTPTEAQGPGTYPVSVAVTDSGTPALSATNTFTVTVNEVNVAPVLAKPADRTVDELALMSFTLSATDTDLPAQTLTYALVSGPAGLTVSGAGAVAWTPTEAQGPGTYPVSVSVTDSGTPALSATNTFSVTVNEVNVAPALAKPADRTMDELTLLTFNLSATDTDLPAQTLTYALVSGPTGLTVSGAGAVAWTPTEAQGPGTYTVSVKVTDSGTPALSATNAFTVTVNEVPDVTVRSLWLIGVDDNPAVLPYNPSGEFSPENRLNDPRPGKVTRLPGDPIYDANPSANPTADDDFYTRGTYPVGFNGLTSVLTVPNDEPAIAWERANTQRDMTNRMHFVLVTNQVSGGATFQLSMEFSSGGVSYLGTNLSSFGTNDMVIRFRNGAGVETVLFSQRILARTNLVLSFTASAVSATAGANTVEIVRTGPAVTNYSYWIQYDYVRLEAFAPVPPAVTLSAEPVRAALAAAPVSASAAMAPTARAAGRGTATLPVAGIPQSGLRVEGGLTYLTLTFGYDGEPSPEVRYVVEGSSDGIEWSEATVIEESRTVDSDRTNITDRDFIPLNQVPSRRLRLKLVPRGTGDPGVGVPIQ